MQNIKKTLKGNTMILILLAVMLFFQVLIVAADKGSLFAPANITNLINQNAWVVILATGMLLCILTGGNIDLSVGSIICLVAQLREHLLGGYVLSCLGLLGLICVGSMLSSLPLAMWFSTNAERRLCAALTAASNFDRCHSFLLAASAAGGARKRPRTHVRRRA